MLRLRGNWEGFQEPGSTKRTVPKEEGGRLYTSQSKAPGTEWWQSFQSEWTFILKPFLKHGRAAEEACWCLQGRWARGPEETQVVVAPEAGRWQLWPWAGHASLHPVRL